MKFKNILFAFLLLTITILSCKKEETDNFRSTAVITGPDVRDCMCCGGYLIEIEDSTYNFEILPVSSQINLNSEIFPLSVKLDWTYDKKCGDIQYIGITRITKE